jgi:hypothetical protein
LPPFSILNARDGVWQNRKREWLAMGINSGLGRSDDLLALSPLMKTFGRSMEDDGATGEAGTSIFDPVLCEIAYAWFCPRDGKILDPFAGGSVRGIVASKLGRAYYGHDLSGQQVEANKMQALVVCKDEKAKPTWKVGDSKQIAESYPNLEADFVFSCPPYADLEVYSDNPKDLSNMRYEDFKAAYFEIIKNSCSLLKQDRFACFVVGEVRDKKGNYYNFVSDTIEAFRAAGLEYYNEMILVTAVGSLPMRSGRIFSASRKIGKTHQNVLVFVKGDAKKATEACGDVNILEMPSIPE